MIVCVPVTPNGFIAPGWGRAARVAVASASPEGITDWRELDVAWDVLHDEGTEGAHHARVVRFLSEHRVEVIVVGGMGAGMARTITAMGLRLVSAASGDARQAVLQAVGGTSSTSPAAGGI